MQVKVTKLASVKSPKSQSCTWQQFDKHNKTLPIEYELRGETTEEPKLGTPFSVVKLKAKKVFRTTPVLKIVPYGDDTIIHTRNSIYLISQEGGRK